MTTVGMGEWRSARDRRGLAALGFGLACVVLGSSGCGEADMVKQPKLKTLQASAFFADGRSARPIEPGTVARGQLYADPNFASGEAGGVLTETIPLKEFDPAGTLDPAAAAALRAKTLARGRERFNIFCAPCHSQLGDGNGMIVQRGFSRPPSLHDKRLIDAPPGHFFRVITNGYGAMYSYASRIPDPADRWAIVAYIRALQLSQNAKLADVPAEKRSALTAAAADATPAPKPPATTKGAPL